jgi:hypothetical protein
MRRGTALTTGFALFAFVLGAGVLAQNKPVPKPIAPPSTAQPKSKPPAEPKAQPPAVPLQQQIVMPDAEKIVLLLRNTLITLNDAIQTGNFTVLRDRGAPGFREANSAARLSQIFAEFAAQGADLSVVSIMTPQLTEAPTLDQEKGMLHIEGYFPGQPVQINFEMLYQVVEGRWRLFGISVNPSQVQPSASTR